MRFDWWTFALQALNFIILVWLLRRFLLKPVTAIVARRKEEIGRAMSEAGAAKLNAEQARLRFEERISEAASERDKLIAEERARMAEERRKLLEEGRAEAEKIRSETRKVLDHEREEAVERAFERSVEIAIELARGLLKEVAIPSAEQAFLGKLVDHLDHPGGANSTAAPPQLLDRDGATVEVTTASELDAAGRAVWSAALRQRIGPAQFVFDTDPALIAGAQVRFPLATLSFNWRDSVARAREQMLSHEQDR